MKLFNRQKDDQEVDLTPVEVQTPQNTKSVEEILQETEDKQRRINWKQTVPRLLATLIVILILAGGVMWAFGVFDGKSSDKDKPASTSQNDKTAPAAPGSDSDNSEGSNSGSGSGQSNAQGNSGNSSSSTPAPSPSTTNPNANSSTSNAQSTGSVANNQLSATGPTETLVVFITVSLTGAVIYQTALRRQHR